MKKVCIGLFAVLIIGLVFLWLSKDVGYFASALILGVTVVFKT